jgi:hypothetical protein
MLVGRTRQPKKAYANAFYSDQTSKQRYCKQTALNVIGHAWSEKAVSSFQQDLYQAYLWAYVVSVTAEMLPEVKASISVVAFHQHDAK